MRIIDFWDQGVRYYANKEAFVDSTSTYTYAEADREIHRIAGAIAFVLPFGETLLVMKRPASPPP